MRKFAFLASIISLLLLGQTAFAQTILYVPADNRPVSSEYVVETAQAAGMDILTPPAAAVANRTNTGNPDELWNWVLSNCNTADAMVVSADALLYGGLVASRTHHFDNEILAQRLTNFKKLKEINPSLRLYVYSTIMRTPKASAGGTEPPYYKKYGPTIFQITALQDKMEMGLLKKDEPLILAYLISSVPQDALTDWFDRRSKNYTLNEGLIAYLKSGIFNYLIQGRDDCSPFSQSHKESRMLSAETKDLPASKYATFPGADQLGMLLVTRAINDLTYQLPIVSIVYAPGAGGKTVPTYEDIPVDQSVTAQIAAAGGIYLRSALHPDLVLAINTPKNGVTLEANNPLNRVTFRPETAKFANDLSKLLSEGKQVSVASIAFANGSDNALMNEMAGRGFLPELAAYSGWNTACNTLGYAIGQGMLADKMTTENKHRLLTIRLLDDWAYQANIRGEVAEKVLWPLGGNYVQLDSLAPRIAAETQQRMQRFAEKNFTGMPANNFSVFFPWNRMFEVGIKLN